MIHDHETIRMIITDLRAQLNQGIPIGLCFANRRWALTRELLRHFAAERTFLQSRGVHEHHKADTPGAVTSAMELEELYRDHIGRWTPREIDSRWREYCRELRGLLRLLERRMVYEETAIYPAIESRFAAVV
jgi:uncharacterized protein YjiS (DUF1127 family)